MIHPIYINSDGFVTVNPNENHIPGEGNGWLQTGLAVACGVYAPSPENIDLLFSRCEYSDECPLLWRSPWKKSPGDETKADDYWAAFFLNHYAKSQWAQDMIWFVEDNEWDFDIGRLPNNDLEYRFDRFPGFAPLLRVAAGKDLSVYDSLQVAISIFYDAFSIEKADGNMRAYCKLALAEKKSRLSKLAAIIWRKRIRAKYGTIGKSWESYFGPAHPLVGFD